MKHSEHVETLLPWLVNGTLGASERQLVEQHLAACAQCRASHALELKLADGLVEHHDSLDCAPQSGWNRLAAQLDYSKPRAPSGKRPRGRYRMGGRRMLSALLVVQAAVIALLGFALVQMIGRAEYRTLSDAVTPAATGGAAMARVVFAEDTSNIRLREILQHVGGNIRNGPSAKGVYTISLGEEAVNRRAAPGEAELAWLRGQPEVLFAEPVTEHAP